MPAFVDDRGSRISHSTQAGSVGAPLRIFLSGGAGLQVKLSDPGVARLDERGDPRGSRRSFVITPRRAGSVMVEARSPATLAVVDAFQLGVVAAVCRDGGGPAPVVFHPGVNHAHVPCGNWPAIQANPGSRTDLDLLCARLSPRELIGAAIQAEFGNKPIGLAHLNWYLFAGRGADFDEADNLKKLLETDGGVQGRLRLLIPRGRRTGTFLGHTEIRQEHYQRDDFQFAFGAIDRLDFWVDFASGTLTAWFQDRYEWHPFYRGLYAVHPGDVPRKTNCVHAACVELKRSGAADSWMKGQATVPLAAVMGSKAAASSRTSF